LVQGSSPRPLPELNGFVAWVYILRGASGRHYIGATENLRRRLLEHERGHVHSTMRFGGAVELIASKQLNSMAEAFALERSLKRKKNPRLAIEALVGFVER